MKKRALFLRGLLWLFAINILVTGCAFGSDDKENEMVDDPLKSKSEYYIVGTVTDVNGPIANAKVSIGSSEALTNNNGLYILTVNEAKSYLLTVSATGRETCERNTSITSNMTNRSQVMVNIKLVYTLAFNKMVPANDAVIKAPKLEDPSNEEAALITIPAEGTDKNALISAVVFEEVKEPQPANSVQPQNSKCSMSNVAIKTAPINAIATQDILISIPNPSETAQQGYFDTEYMEMESTDLAVTKAIAHKVDFQENSYRITLPKGNQITGVYSAKVRFTKQANNSISDGYNEVNGKAGVLKIENRSYSAMTDVALALKIKSGWDYTTSPADALKAVGASTALASSINKYIENEEGGRNGSYDIEYRFTAGISGNHVLYYGSQRMVHIKTYTFRVMVKGVSKQVIVKLKSYAEDKREYTNAPISQHSGGGNGSQN